MADLVFFDFDPPPHSDRKHQPAKYQSGDLVEAVEDNGFLGAAAAFPPFRLVRVPEVKLADPRIIRLLARAWGNGEILFRTDLGWATHKREGHINLGKLKTYAERKLKRSLATGESIWIKTAKDLSFFFGLIDLKRGVPQSGRIG